MGGCPDGKPHLHGIAHANALEEYRQQNRTDNPGEYDGDCSNRRQPAEHFGKCYADRGGNRFGDERARGDIRQAEQPAKANDTDDRDQ